MQFVSFVEDLPNQQLDGVFFMFWINDALSIFDMRHPSEFSLLSPPWVPGDFHQFILNLPLGGRHVRLFLNISTSICKVQFLSLFSPGRERTIGSSRPFLGWNRCGRGLWPLEKENSWLRKHLALPFIFKAISVYPTHWDETPGLTIRNTYK